MSLHSPAPRPGLPTDPFVPAGRPVAALGGTRPAPAQPPEQAAPARLAPLTRTARSHPEGAKRHAPTSSQRDHGARPNVAAMGGTRAPSDAPALFVAATEALRAALEELRPDVAVREIPAPARIAPYAFALAGGLTGDDEAASGRFVLLFDPDGQDAWEGTTRVVCYARASVDPEVADDPLLPGVAWSWLRESLQSHGAEVGALGGTVTTTSSRRFGVLATDGDNFDVELRCSWSPRWAGSAGEPEGTAVPETSSPGGTDGAPLWDPADAAAHLHSFADLLAAMAGLPPRLSGVVPLPARRA
ncbi:DUF3000 domain-containing protein [Parafrankia discariae]|uniref:DUF3000 domain-containing protein n=1 Tax=Parafrankia discariae TaxID=365528 RepID=UPI0003788CE5|nr:DUF3000 domain-containing protein [Parafrankia discariae]